MLKEVGDLTSQIEGTELELCATRANDTSQEQVNIFVWKDIRRKMEMSCDQPKIRDASMQPQTPSVGSKILETDCVFITRHDIPQNHPQSSGGGGS